MRWMIPLLVLSLPIGVAQADGAESVAAGTKHYKRCAACHLPNGAGVPGAFPPLTGKPSVFFNSEEGRQYLVMVLDKGLMGTMEVGGVTYRGMMPAQGSWLKDAGIAETLNYLMVMFNADVAGKPFSEGEVADIRASLKSENARSALGLRPSGEGENQ